MPRCATLFGDCVLQQRDYHATDKPGGHAVGPPLCSLFVVIAQVAIAKLNSSVKCCRQGWWNWGLSGVSSILGYVPSKEQPQALPMRPTQAEMQELYAALSLDPHNLPDGKDPSRKLEVVTDVKVWPLLTNLA